MSPESSENALEALTKMGVEVKLHSKVVDYCDHKVILESGEEIPTRSFIWVSGVSAVDIGNMDHSWLGRGRRIKVDEFNRIIGSDNLFAIGDQCLMTSDSNFPNGHPQMAQPAIQQGELLAQNLVRLDRGEPMEPFRYNDLGSMATIGRNRAVAEFANMKLHGWFAWLIWLVVHLRSLLGIRNKVLVLLNWTWNYITYDYSMRLIIYARRAKEIIEREIREANCHWGEDVLGPKKDDET
jgi:NADH dehydrogenase